MKVKSPEKYNWDPKWLLSHLIDIYLHLDSKTLAAAMANDQRSFDMETFKVRLGPFTFLGKKVREKAISQLFFLVF